MSANNVRVESPAQIIEIPRQLTADDIRSQVNLIQRVMKAVMKKDTHFGIIPGCKKPSLYKAGSEILLTTFKISVIPEVIELSNQDRAQYRVLTRGIHRDSGTVVGVGVGECSSDEDKYKWRAAVCNEEWEDTPVDRRREKWNKGKDGGKPFKVKQVRTEIADVANTVLKMAKKRSQIDLTLTSTAASDIFTQDIEDMPEELRETATENEGSKAEPSTNNHGPQNHQESGAGIQLCDECGLTIADSPDRAAQVKKWCQDHPQQFENKILCQKCQKKVKERNQ